MRDWLLDFLRCPFCAGTVQASAKVAGDGDVCTDGLLHCPTCCFDFPIVGGVPILRHPDDTLDAQNETTERVIVPGPRVRDIAHALKDGDRRRAFELVLNPFTLGGPVIPTSLAAWKPKGLQRGESPTVPTGLANGSNALGIKAAIINRIRKNGLLATAKANAKKAMLPLWRKSLARYLTERRDRLSALEIIELYYGFYSNSEISNYFSYRYTQPRHLAALCLASVLRDSKEAVLDLACGVGHLAHYLSYGQPDKRVVGIDRDFFRLFIAQNFIAPQASFVCGEADTSVPFADSAFGSVFCSDAFFCFLQRASAAREMVRVIGPEGNIVLTRTRNFAVEPRQGYELTADGYRRLFAGCGLKSVLFSENTLVRQYLGRQGLDLTVDDEANLERSEWLSIFASQSDAPFKHHPAWTEWPHAVGRLGVNPLYERTPRDGQIGLKVRFPSGWYRYQNEKFLEYAQAECSVPAALISALGAGEAAADEVQPYIDRFVVIGMPDRYLPVAAGGASSAGATP
ncbi:MAG: methyltransferase domain-containing protein [Defluviicoccus sp.]|nr:methyltransferase domain-containing protein [Defluviicoccus sp.]MDG4607657.1 methyltransferase domain-containing protein [Defluviicoccus sp.]